CNHAPGAADAKSSHRVDRPNPASSNKNLIEYLRCSVVIVSNSVGLGSVTHKMPMKDTTMSKACTTTGKSTNDTGDSIAPSLAREMAPMISAATLSNKHVGAAPDAVDGHVPNQVSNHRRVARVDFGDALLELTDDIGADVGGLGVDGLPNCMNSATTDEPNLTMSWGISVALMTGGMRHAAARLDGLTVRETVMRETLPRQIRKADNQAYYFVSKLLNEFSS
ncbi:hypothetical protein DYB36_011991, partial [Aphanomyces astaci]